MASFSGRRGIPLSYCFMSLLGFPFKWAKTRGGFRVEWLGMETEYNSYRLGLTKKRADWLVNWLREVVTTGSVMARDMSQRLGRLGFAAIALDWERPFLGPLYAFRETGEGGSDATVMLRVLMSWLANRLEGGERLQRPDVGVQGAIPLVFYTDARAEDGRAWIGGFLDIFAGCQGPWFSLEVEKGWAPWAFVKGDTKKVIAALELLAKALGPRGTDKADFLGSYQRIHGQPVQ